MLIEKCGDLLPLYAKLIGGEAFKAYFNIILPTFIKKTVIYSIFGLLVKSTAPWKGEKIVKKKIRTFS